MNSFQYPDVLSVEPLQHVPQTVVTIPGSKSITNRALILAALADGHSVLVGALDSEDTRVMIDSLRRLGFEVISSADGTEIQIEGRGGNIPSSGAELFLQNSGTSIRFLTALAALGKGKYRLDGIERMRQRPQADLLDSLADMGVGAFSEQGNGCPPIVVEGNGALRGGTVHVGADASSQFLSALLMVAPYAQKDTTLQVHGKLRPFYVDITRRMMEQWGVNARCSHGLGSLNAAEPSYYVVAGQKYRAQPIYSIEPDASSASYFFAIAALTGGSITIPGLSRDSLQGDVRFATEVLAEMGCEVVCTDNEITVRGTEYGKLRGINKDMSAISDTSLTLAALAPFADSPTTVTGIAHSRLQECDRIKAVCTELQKLGVRAEEHEDGWTVYPAKQLSPAKIETYNDHRVAMSFALIGLRSAGVEILNPACVTKTFPNFWQQLDTLRSSH